MRNCILLIFGLTLLFTVRPPRHARGVPFQQDTTRPTAPVPPTAELMEQLDSVKADRDKLKKNIEEVISNTQKIDKAATKYINAVKDRNGPGGEDSDTVYISREVRVPVAIVDTALSLHLKHSLEDPAAYKTWWGKLIVHFRHCTWFRQLRVFIEATPQYKVLRLIFRFLKRKL